MVRAVACGARGPGFNPSSTLKSVFLLGDRVGTKNLNFLGVSALG